MVIASRRIFPKQSVNFIRSEQQGIESQHLSYIPTYNACLSVIYTPVYGALTVLIAGIRYPDCASCPPSNGSSPMRTDSSTITPECAIKNWTMPWSLMASHSFPCAILFLIDFILLLFVPNYRNHVHGFVIWLLYCHKRA